MKNHTSGDSFIPPQPHLFALLTEGAVTPPIFCCGGGRCFTASASYCYDGMNRGDDDFSFWQYIISGGIQLELGGARTLLRPGQTMLLSVPEEHIYRLTRECGHMDAIYLCFSGAMHRRLFADLRSISGSVFDTAASSAILPLAASWLETLASGKVISIYDSAAFAMKFLMTLASELDRGEAGNLRFDAKAKMLLHRSPLHNVEEMCRTSGYSREYFIRRFREVKGKTPARFIADERMNHAAELLRQTDLSVAEIGERCGYGDCAYFCRIFRRKYGAPPGQWRRRTLPETKLIHPEK